MDINEADFVAGRIYQMAISAKAEGRTSVKEDFSGITDFDRLLKILFKTFPRASITIKKPSPAKTMLRHGYEIEVQMEALEKE